MEIIPFEPTPEQEAALSRLRKKTGHTAHYLISQAIDHFIGAEMDGGTVHSFDKLAERLGLTGWTEETFMAEIQKGIVSGEAISFDFNEFRRRCEKKLAERQTNGG